MGAISSLRDETMRVLIVSLLVAYAYGAPAPSVLGPLAVVPAGVDPGDLQAAAIDAQVRAEDQARALQEKIVEDTNEKITEVNDQVKEKSEEVFWSAEEKKWQALDAVQTAAAKLDGAVAGNADAIARAAFGGVIVPSYIASPIVPGLPPPLVAPISPIVYANPGFVANKIEEKEKEKEKEIVKTAEPEKDSNINKEGEKKDEKLEDKLVKPLAAPVLTPLVGPAWVGPVAPLSPVGSLAPVFVQQPLLTPVIKTQW